MKIPDTHFMVHKNRRCIYIQLLLLLLLLLHPYLSEAQRNIPAHKGTWVQDEAGILSSQTVQQLQHALQEHSDSTSNQIAVLIIKSLDGDDIDDFGVRVFKAWKLGQQGKDNGVLLVVAIDDRKVRIEVGYGLEGSLTDLQANRIIRNEMAPRFRNNDYDGGIKASVIAILQSVQGEYTNDAPRAQRGKKQRSPLMTVLIMLAVIIFLSRRNGGGGRGGKYSSRGGGWIPMAGLGGFGSSGGGSWGGGSFGGGGFSGGGGSSGSW